MHTPLRVSSGPAGRVDAPSFGILSTFPPTSCGIATFSAALAAGLIGEGASVDVVRCGATPEVEDVLVVGSLTDPDDADHRRAIDALNRNDLVIVQHEYGLYGGVDGESIIDLVTSIDAPVVVVAHTVLTEPTENQQRILEQVCRSADAVVVMTRTAHARLLDGYDIDGSKVHVIPHGAATPLAAPSASQRRAGTPKRLLTWGLLGPGKGIEWAIDAMDELRDVDPLPEYVVAGATHPKVRERHGEAYRQMLVAKAYASLVLIPEWLVRTLLMRARGTPQVHTGPGVFVGEEMAGGFFGRLLLGINLFDLWQLWILGVGVAVMARAPEKKVLAGLLILWLLWISFGAAIEGMAPRPDAIPGP